MKEKLTRLQNALCTINTKGQDTITMADCLKFISQMMNETEEGKESKDEE
jgi:hypothetical protein